MCYQDQDDIKKLIASYTRRLQLLKERQAQQGLETPTSVITEIEDIEEKIKQLQTELENPVGVPSQAYTPTPSSKITESPRKEAMKSINGIVIKFKGFSVEISWIVIALVVLYLVIQHLA